VNGRIALAGNPNSGKTTIFNLLVGAQETIGNWPGTTVEHQEGRMTLSGQDLTVVDLPGTYSLNAQSIDEVIARDYLVKQDPALTVAVVDATNLEHGMLLVLQLLEMGQNVVVVLNKMDLCARRGVRIDTPELSQVLKVPVVETVAAAQQGIAQLQNLILSSLQRKTEPLRIDYGDLEPAVEALTLLFKERLPGLSFSHRALAVKFLTGDQRCRDEIEQAGLSAPAGQMKDQFELPRNLESAVVERKYALIKGLLKEVLTKEMTVEERLTISDKIDRVVTHRVLGLPLFLGLMYAVFHFVFTLGDPLVGLIERFFELLSVQVTSLFALWGWPAWMTSLFCEGIIAGVGSVLTFLPYIMLLYLGISFLQDSGYLARAAFIMDRFMHMLGLHGKSFIPMLLGFGCNIPGIMATRTLSSEKDRILTIMVLPLMSCAARLPVYTLFAAALFPKHQGLVVFSLYVMGIVLAVAVAKVLRNVFFKDEVGHLIMELPPYRMPSARGVIKHMWMQAYLFVKKAGTIIFFFVVLTWALASLPWGVEYASEHSLIGQAGKFVSGIFAPAGFGFWQAAVALFFGIMAKEVVVGILGTLYGVDGAGLTGVLQQHFTPLSGYAFLVMIALYIPCVATIAVIKKETNWKWAGLAAGYTFVLGWTISVMIYQVGRLIIGS